MKDILVGIDLGTTNSLIGLIDTGFPVLVPGGDGSRLTPSVVHFPPGGGDPVVGAPAKRSRLLHPDRTISSIKRFMGRRFAELSDAEKQAPYKLVPDGEGNVALEIDEKLWSPAALSALILKKLKQDAERYLGQAVTKAVITVPAYFNDAQRTATKKAGELAGLEVVRILNEPTAAALAYGFDKNKRKGRCAVYDLGGGTFDISILELSEGVFQVLSTQGNTRLGGDDVDQALARSLADDFAKESGAKTGDEAWLRFVEAAEPAKIALSQDETTSVQLPFLAEGRSFSKEVTRAELETLARKIIEPTRNNCRRALSDARLQPGDLDEVLLVGGMTRMPLVRELVREIFGKEPNTQANPDEAVALGAAIQAGILSGALSDMVLLDVTPLSLGIETFGGLMNSIIPRNSTIPCKAGEQFTNAVDGQQSMKIRILQGERELARDNWTLGEMVIGFTPSPRGTARVGVQFEIDADGILHVLARDIQTGRDWKVDVSSAVDVSNEEVEKMVAESVEHAFEDMEERQFIEQELKAKRTLEMTAKAVAVLEGRLSPEEQAAVDQLVAGVNDSIATRRAVAVRQALKALDEGTKGLADKLVELAAERAFDA